MSTEKENLQAYLDAHLKMLKGEDSLIRDPKTYDEHNLLMNLMFADDDMKAIRVQADKFELEWPDD